MNRKDRRACEVSYPVAIWCCDLCNVEYDLYCVEPTRRHKLKFRWRCEENWVDEKVGKRKKRVRGKQFAEEENCPKCNKTLYFLHRKNGKHSVYTEGVTPKHYLRSAQKILKQRLDRFF